MSLAELRRPRTRVLLVATILLSVTCISLLGLLPYSPFTRAPTIYRTASWPKKQHPEKPSFSRTLVIAKTQSADATWVDELARDDPTLETAIYTVDDANASLTVPQNKGHEVMVYLTYLIDHYFDLRDVTIFMHSDRITWHNNDLLNMDSALMVSWLRSEYVGARGYANLRCQHDPGCPAHVRLDDIDDFSVPEAAVIGDAWMSLFPDDPIPSVLAQPCCGQFAVSAETVWQIPLLDFVAYRRWLLDTDLDDLLSGRVWEYVWQWLFTDRAVDCPDERKCYCEAYGVCLSGEEFAEYWHLQNEARRMEDELRTLTGHEGLEVLREQVDVFHARMEEITTLGMTERVHDPDDVDM